MNEQPSITKTRNLDGVASKMKQLYGAEVQRTQNRYPNIGPKYSLDLTLDLKAFWEEKEKSPSLATELPSSNARESESNSAKKDNFPNTTDVSEKQVQSPSREKKGYINRKDIMASQTARYGDSIKKLNIHRHDEELVYSKPSISPTKEVRIGVIEVSEVMNPDTNDVITDNSDIQSTKSSM
jgi:hypothetical protein